MKLNPEWLVAAKVISKSGEFIGIVSSVGENGDDIVVLVDGEPHNMSASELDAAGRINHAHAMTSKFVE